LQNAVVFGGPFKNRVAQPTNKLQLPVWYPFEGKVLNYGVVRKILYERIINLSPKIRNTYTRNTMREAPKRGARGNCFICLQLNTPLYIILIMILYENMKPIEHVLVQTIRFLSHLMYAWKHKDIFVLVNTLKFLINLVEVADEFITSKDTDSTRFFIIKPTHSVRLKTQI